MHISTSALLGVAFLGLAVAATFTMFQFWGYEYDEVNKKSSCPQWKMNIHRGIGFAYVLVYILMMIEMVPRLWEYQVEFPVRTVVHILLGATIGIILIIKISILRFFRHFEEWMPVLGVSLLVCTVLLGVMSMPAFFRERALAEGAVGGGVYSIENRDRVAGLLPNAGFPEGVDLKALSTQPVLEKGRRVLLDKCVACHDLKTVIARPRTPEDWVRTNKRMALKPSLGVTISEHEGHQAAAYLIAITPNLQRSAKSKRADGLDRGESIRAAEEVLVALDAGVPEAPDAGAPEVAPEPPETPTTPTKAKPDKPEPKPAVKKPAVKKPVKTPFDMAKAKSLYEEECSLCHGLSDVTDAPPGSRKEVNQVLSRMIENGLDLEKEDLSLIRGYMVRRFVK
jgi:cytochrome c5